MKSIVILTFLAALASSLAPSAHANGWCNPHPQCGPHNPPPPTLRCDAGGPYTVNAEMGVVSIQLDGTDSFGATSWTWTTSYPGAFFDDRNVPNPILTIPVGGDCSFNVHVSLTVRKQNQTKHCSTTVRVRDNIKPKITCPPLAKVTCGEDTSPQALGFATATDNCDTNVKITYKDKIIPPDCNARRFDHVIQRTWKATDNDCNVSTCVQLIDVVKQVVSLDILPGACPNLYDREACSLLPVAILGSADFDVTQIQWSSVKAYGVDCTAGPVKAHSFQLADVGTPFFGADCDCTDLNGDGFLDLVAKFKRNKINDKFDLCDVDPGTPIEIIITGKLNCSGCKFIAQDCIVVQ
jgi:hypothetical protein